MLETPHVALGVAIATKIPNPYIAIPLAFASHFVLDRVPHWNPHLNTEVAKYGKVTKKTTYTIIGDVIIALALGSFFAKLALPNTTHAMVILAASFASVLPDVIEAPYFFLNKKNAFIRNWIKFQKSIQVDVDIVPGLITQVITVAAAIAWALS